MKTRKWSKITYKYSMVLKLVTYNHWKAIRNMVLAIWKSIHGSDALRGDGGGGLGVVGVHWHSIYKSIIAIAVNMDTQQVKQNCHKYIELQIIFQISSLKYQM